MSPVVRTVRDMTAVSTTSPTSFRGPSDICDAVGTVRCMTPRLHDLIAAGTLVIAGDLAAAGMLLDPYDPAEIFGVVAGAADMLFDTCVVSALEAFPPPRVYAETAMLLARAAKEHDADNFDTVSALGAQALTDPAFGLAAASVFAALLRTAADIDNCDALSYARRCCLVAATPTAST